KGFLPLATDSSRQQALLGLTAITMILPNGCTAHGETENPAGSDRQPEKTRPLGILMLGRTVLVAGVALALIVPACATEPHKFRTKESATEFCKDGNVVWFNPHRKFISRASHDFTARLARMAEVGSLVAHLPINGGFEFLRTNDRRDQFGNYQG